MGLHQLAEEALPGVNQKLASVYLLKPWPSATTSPGESASIGCGLLAPWCRSPTLLEWNRRKFLLRNAAAVAELADAPG